MIYITERNLKVGLKNGQFISFVAGQEYRSEEIHDEVDLSNFQAYSDKEAAARRAKKGQKSTVAVAQMPMKSGAAPKGAEEVA